MLQLPKYVGVIHSSESTVVLDNRNSVPDKRAERQRTQATCRTFGGENSHPRLGLVRGAVLYGGLYSVVMRLYYVVNMTSSSPCSHFYLTFDSQCTLKTEFISTTCDRRDETTIVHTLLPRTPLGRHNTT